MHKKVEEICTIWHLKQFIKMLKAPYMMITRVIRAPKIFHRPQLFIILSVQLEIIKGKKQRINFWQRISYDWTLAQLLC